MRTAGRAVSRQKLVLDLGIKPNAGALRLIHVELLPHEGFMERACLFRMTCRCRSVGGVRRSERPIPSWFALLVCTVG